MRSVVQMLFVLWGLDGHPCALPARIAYTDTIMYVAYPDTVEEYIIRRIHPKGGKILIQMDGALCMITMKYTHLRTNKGHELLLREISVKEYLVLRQRRREE